MVDKSDWRLQGQERYLKGLTLVHRRYHRYPENPDWEHDHCEFCWKTFMVEEYPDSLHEGYTTTDEYRWICDDCFKDFHEMFDWTIIDNIDQAK